MTEQKGNKHYDAMAPNHHLGGTATKAPKQKLFGGGLEINTTPSSYGHTLG